jgi:hypothetical protein
MVLSCSQKEPFGAGKRDRRLSPAASRALCLHFSLTARLIVLSHWKLIYRTGQNEMKRYKKKHVESAVAICGYG